MLFSETCLEGLKSTPYTGTASITNHGFVCQHWKSQHPHTHPFTINDFFPVDGTVNNASNYCRDLLGYGRPWCYTTSPSVQRDFCTFSICKGRIPLNKCAASWENQQCGFRTGLTQTGLYKHRKELERGTSRQRSTFKVET